MTGDLEFPLYQREAALAQAEEHGIRDLVESAFFPPGRISAIRDLSIQLCREVLETRKLESSGETHLIGRKKALGQSFVNFLISEMILACSLQDEAPPPPDGARLVV